MVCFEISLLIDHPVQTIMMLIIFIGGTVIGHLSDFYNT